MTKLKKIKPLFFYDKNHKPIMVKLSLEDFNYFTKVLKQFSEAAKKKGSKKSTSAN